MVQEDVVFDSGGDSGMRELIVEPKLAYLVGLKGQTLLVDATNTAYALQLKKILLMNGMKEGADYQIYPIGGTSQRLRGLKEDKKYKAAMLNLPFSLDAKASGLKSMGRATDLLGPYQANGAFVLRKWGTAHRDLLERYIAGLIEGTRWALAPANKDAAVTILAERLKVNRDFAAQTWQLMTDPKISIAKD